MDPPRIAAIPPIHLVAVQLAAFVVEDNAEIRENLAAALEELTCVKVVGGAPSEAAALEWIAQHTGWDLLVVDLFLKGGSGMHVVQQVRRSHAGQRIIVFSNYVNATVRKRCAQLGVDAVFDKSTEIDALLDYCALQCAQASRTQEGSGPPSPGQPGGLSPRG